MSDPDIAVGASVTITDGPFATLPTTITEIDTPSQKTKGVIELFGCRSPVELHRGPVE
jgi:transcriptional antiterminator NusG